MGNLGVDLAGDVVLVAGLAGEEDEHVAGGILGHVVLVDGGQGVLVLVVDEHEGVEELGVLDTGTDVLRLGLVEVDTGGLVHGVHEGGGAVAAHVLVLQQGGHGVVNTIGVDALKGGVAQDSLVGGGADGEEGHDVLVGVVVHLGAVGDLNAVDHHGLEEKQGLHDSVELDIVLKLVEAAQDARVVAVKVLLYGKSKGLELETLDSVLLVVEEEAAVDRLAEGQGGVQSQLVTDVREKGQVLLGGAEAEDDLLHLVGGDPGPAVVEVVGADSHDLGDGLVELRLVEVVLDVELALGDGDTARDLGGRVDGSSLGHELRAERAAHRRLSGGVNGAGLRRLVDEASIAADVVGLAGDSGSSERRRSGAKGLLSWCEIRHLVYGEQV